MAKDDYFSIVYQILKYLYDCLKKGEKPNPEFLSWQYLNIPQSYWKYIFDSLLEYGLVKDFQSIQTKDGLVFGNFDDMQITPQGIQYLFENNLISKARKTLKDIKDIIDINPFKM